MLASFTDQLAGRREVLVFGMMSSYTGTVIDGDNEAARGEWPRRNSVALMDVHLDAERKLDQGANTVRNLHKLVGLIDVLPEVLQSTVGQLIDLDDPNGAVGEREDLER